VDELRAENLQSFLQFFDLMLNVFLYGGNFMKAVTNVNIHERLGLALRSRATKCYLSRIVHPVKKMQVEN
jgi:hypothetical protein